MKLRNQTLVATVILVSILGFSLVTMSPAPASGAAPGTTQNVLVVNSAAGAVPTAPQGTTMVEGTVGLTNGSTVNIGNPVSLTTGSTVNVGNSAGNPVLV